MKLHYAGEKSRAICETDGLTTTTFAYRDVPFSDSPGVAEGILVAVCDKCGKVAAIPPQSTPAIKATRERATIPVEAILPAIYLEALDLACYRIEPLVTPEFRKRLLMYYVHRFAHEEKKSVRKIFNRKPPKAFLEGEKLSDRRRLSLKISPSMSQDIDRLAEIGDVTRTNLFKSLIYQIDKDIIVARKPANLSELRRLAATTIG